MNLFFLCVCVFKVIYFQLSNDPTLPTQNYIGASVDIDPNTVYVGQLLFTTGTPFPTTSLSSGTLYGYTNTSTSNTTVLGSSFGATNFVIKIPTNSQFGYNVQTCKYTFYLYNSCLIHPKTRVVFGCGHLKTQI